MPFQPASPGSVVVFLGLVGSVIAAFLAAVEHAYRSDPQKAKRVTTRTGLLTAGWLALTWAVVDSGLLTHLPWSGLPFFFGTIVIVSVSVGLSPLGRQIAATVPLPALVAFQGFRLPLELVLHRWVADGTIPATMSWSGQNWDIFSGIVALTAAPFVRRHRAAAWVANGIGLVLLLNVMRVAVLSSPLPFGWPVQPPLLLALHLPYALIGPVCVGGAIVGHIVLTRALLPPLPAK